MFSAFHNFVWPAAILMLCAAAGCSPSRVLESPPGLLGRDREMIIHRTDQGRTATVQFFTRFPAYCKVEYWPREFGDDPRATLRKSQRCFRKNPGQTHFVRIEHLAENKPLYIRLLVSSDRTLQSYDDSLVLKETTSHYSYFPPQGLRKAGKSDMLVSVIKANLTQASASVYSSAVPQDQFAEQKRLFTDHSEGCQPYTIAYPSSLMPPRDMGITELSSSGYFSTHGVRIDKGRGIFLLEFTGKIESAERWFFKFVFGSSYEAGEGHKVVHGLIAPPELRSVYLNTPNAGSGARQALQKHDLTTFGEPMPWDKGQGLSFTWQAKNTSEKDYFEILIGKPSRGYAVKCQYSARTKILEVPAEDLAAMKNKAWDVIVSLNRRVVSEPKQGHAVFLHSHDWRHLSVLWR